MLKRSLQSLLEEVLTISPSILLSGARQVGKSTLSLSLDRSYKVFDNLSQRESALNDPNGYITALEKPVTLDEIQKVPMLLEAIKLDIDSKRENGTFLLTGSANILDMNEAKDTLAGRIIEIKMWPLSAKELQKKPDENLIDILFKKDLDNLENTSISDEAIYNTILNGGYPEIQKIKSSRAKSLWFDSYISTYVERDIRDVGELRDITSFIKFFNIIAPRSCSLINKSNLASDAAISEATANNYLSMLEMIYQISLLKPYSSNISKRFIKSQKLYMTDSGILSHLLGITTTQELLDSKRKGEIIETFVYSELLKHISYSHTLPQIYHYRTNDKKEIDFILQKGEKIIAIEVKSSQNVKKDDFKHIIDFQKKSNENILGIVLYMGDSILPFNEDAYKRYALPISIFF